MIPFLQLTPGEDAAAVRAAIDRVIERGWFVLGPELEAFEAEFAAAASAAARGRRRHRHRRDRDRPPLPRHRPRRRSHHLSALGRLQRPGDHDGRRPSGVRRHRSRPADARSRRRRRGGHHGADRGDPAGASLRPARRHAGDHGASPRATTWRSSRTAARRTWRPAAGSRSAASARSAAYSFYPTKNLGALGDGGALTTADAHWRRAPGACATAARRTAIITREFGVNSRLDEMQAAILRARLHFLPGWTGAPALRWRGGIAPRSRRVTASPCPPEQDPGHVYHLFPVLSPEREAVRATPRDAGDRDADSLPGADPAAAGAGRRAPADCPVADRVCGEVFSLPLYPSLPAEAVERVAAALRRGLSMRRRARRVLLFGADRRWSSSSCSKRPAALGQLRGGAGLPGTLHRRHRSSATGLKPGARIRFATSEFDTEIAINNAGVRDDEEIGPKPPDERRIVVLGDSLVLSVQVPFDADVRRAARAAAERGTAGGPRRALSRHQRRRPGLRAGRGAAVLQARRARRSSRISCW